MKRNSANNDFDESEDEVVLGDYNDLTVLRFVDFGLYLEAGDMEILLPLKKIPEGTKVGDELRVLVYKDSENRYIATTDVPKLTVDMCEVLEVMDVNRYGAFVDWGIDNQLLVPYAEQAEPLHKGDKVAVYMYHDPVSDRLVGSTRMDKRLHNEYMDLQEGDSVELYIFSETDIGFKAAINCMHIGLLYHSEIDQDIHVGQKIMGYVKKVREDHKVDLCLRQPGFERVLNSTDLLLEKLKENKGFLPLNDKSSPDEIKKKLNMSKGDFKKASGMLYKKRKIVFEGNGIRLADFKRN